MPPSTQRSYVATLVYPPLNGAQLQEEEEEFDREDEIEPPQPQPRIEAPAAVPTVTVRLPLNANVCCDVDFPVNITHKDFFRCIFTNMALDCATAELGWKSSDEPKRGPAHRLATNNSKDLEGAFRTLLEKMNQPRHQQEIFMEITHLNPKKNSNDSWATNCVYSAELRLVQEKLLCNLRACPNIWCYVAPDKPDEHVELGFEEIVLWARTIHENKANPDCLLPPDCLRLPGVPRMAGHACTTAASQPLVPPIRIHINNFPLPPKADADRTAVLGPSTQNLKRSHSVTSSEEDSGSDSDEEALPLSDVIGRLHSKFPQLNLPQYIPLFKQEGIVYAKTFPKFTADFYVDLGLTEGAVSQLLSSIKRILISEKRGKKRVCRYSRESSVEI